MSPWSAAARLLCFASERPHWVNLTLQLDARGCRSPRLEWVSTEADLIAQVHEHEFDILILAIAHVNHFESQVQPLVQSIRTSGNLDPVLLLSEQIQPRELARCYEANVEFLQSSLYWDAPALVPAIERARRRLQLAREHQTWGRERQQKLQQDHRDSERILEQQRRMLDDLRSLAHAAELDRDPPEYGSDARPRSAERNFFTELKSYYAALLRSYVVMGTGSLSEEIRQVVLQIEMCNLSVRETMALHLEQVEELVRGLGNRSSRHVMNRADMLILELLMHLAETRRGGVGQPEDGKQGCPG
ncbi:MAG: hypothetical protein CMJ46_08655 [Planctomyces sp.]|nr:hypothetical protein [Planctomyces sp.]